MAERDTTDLRVEAILGDAFAEAHGLYRDESEDHPPELDPDDEEEEQ
jgi:hypothetical protein